MRCEDARPALSARFDGETNGPIAPAELDAHLAECAACSRALEEWSQLRQQLRFESVGAEPDLAPDVVRRIQSVGPHRFRVRIAVAAAFVAGAVAGATLAGLGGGGTAPASAAEIARRIGVAQGQVTSLTADVRVVERGWHPRVPVRGYRGTLTFRAPESVNLRVEDRTVYPDGSWRPNDVDLVVDAGSWWARGPAPCPREAQPGCTPPTPRVRAVANREPFADDAPAPLDLIVPVRSFSAGGARAVVRGERTFGERTGVGVIVTAAQIEPLLAGLRRAGNWREVHPSDRVELWLDREFLTPLAASVFPAPGRDRQRWARARGHRDAP
jgi:hypothetical protein